MEKAKDSFATPSPRGMSVACRTPIMSNMPSDAPLQDAPHGGEDFSYPSEALPLPACEVEVPLPACEVEVPLPACELPSEAVPLPASELAHPVPAGVPLNMLLAYPDDDDTGEEPSPAQLQSDLKAFEAEFPEAIVPAKRRKSGAPAKAKVGAAAKPKSKVGAAAKPKSKVGAAAKPKSKVDAPKASAKVVAAMCKAKVVPKAVGPTGVSPTAGGILPSLCTAKGYRLRKSFQRGNWIYQVIDETSHALCQVQMGATFPWKDELALAAASRILLEAAELSPKKGQRLKDDLLTMRNSDEFADLVKVHQS